MNACLRRVYRPFKPQSNLSEYRHDKMPNMTDLVELNTYLTTRSYISGYKFSSEDVKTLKALSSYPDPTAHPHAFRWAKHISALSGSSVTVKVAAAPAKAAAAAPSKPAAKAEAADSFDDMFGDDEPVEPKKAAVNDIFDEDEGDNDEEKAANRARRERMENARRLKEEKDAKDGKKKEKKDKPAEKSLIVLDVKPWEANTDLKALWEQIIQYKQDGLTWGESFKLEPVAYGIMKLVMTVTIEDAKVLLDDITENIEAIEEFVQSVTVASMNKI